MENYPIINNPDGLNIQLFKHQLTSIYYMELLEETKCIKTKNGHMTVKLGINGDMSGSGKTLSMIGLMTRNIMKWDIDFPYQLEKTSSSSHLLVEYSIVKQYTKIDVNIILVSVNSLNNWKKQLKYAKDLKISQITNKKELINIDVITYDVILVTSNIYNNFSKKFKDYAWKRFIFDDPGEILIKSMNHIVAGFYWLLTPTPNDIIIKYNSCRKKWER